MSSTEDLKKKASRIISGFSSLAEKNAHRFLDGAQEIVKDISNAINSDDNDQLDIAPGDYCVSPADILNTNTGDKIIAGQIFKFTEEIRPYINTKIKRITDVSQAVEMTKTREYSNILKIIRDTPMIQDPEYTIEDIKKMDHKTIVNSIINYIEKKVQQ